MRSFRLLFVFSLFFSKLAISCDTCCWPSFEFLYTLLDDKPTQTTNSPGPMTHSRVDIYPDHQKHTHVKNSTALTKNFFASGNSDESYFVAETLPQALQLSTLYADPNMVHNLKLVEHDPSGGGAPTLKQWDAFFASIKYLDTLHLQYDLSTDYLISLTQNLEIKNLRKLSLQGASIDWTIDGVNALLGFLAQHTNIEVLDLSVLTYDDPLLDLGSLPPFPNLKSLTINATQIYHDAYLNSVASFIAKTPTLESLRIEQGLSLSFAGLEPITKALASSCPKLNSFSADLGSKSSVALFTQVLTGCPLVKKLESKSFIQAPQEAFDLFLDRLATSKIESIRFSSFETKTGDTYNRNFVSFMNTLSKLGSIKNLDVAFTIVTPGTEHGASPEVEALSSFISNASGASLESLSLGYTGMNAFDAMALAKSFANKQKPVSLFWQIDTFGNVVLPPLVPLIGSNKIILNANYKPHLNSPLVENSHRSLN